MNNSPSAPCPPSSLKIAEHVLDIEIEALKQVRDGLDGAFEDAIRLMLTALQAGHKIVVSGIGKNLHIAEKISATLASTGSTSVVLNPTQAMHGDMGILAAGDVLLALSYSGSSDEILALVPLVRRQGIRIVSLTGAPQSALADFSDVVISVTVAREACPFNMAPTASTTATLAVGDALAMALLEARGFQREDYAKLHPGGAIGRALLCRVADIMRTGERVAIVPLSATVQDVLVAMTGARAGSACITNAEGHLKGIFTDGDLRRHMVNGSLTADVASVMTADPVRVCADQLAVDVLHIFETHTIDDLPVVDRQGLVVGAVDIQDLPGLKIL